MSKSVKLVSAQNLQECISAFAVFVGTNSLLKSLESLLCSINPRYSEDIDLVHLHRESPVLQYAGINRWMAGLAHVVAAFEHMTVSSSSLHQQKLACKQPGQ